MEGVWASVRRVVLTWVMMSSTTQQVVEEVEPDWMDQPQAEEEEVEAGEPVASGR